MNTFSDYFWLVVALAFFIYITWCLVKKVVELVKALAAKDYGHAKACGLVTAVMLVLYYFVFFHEHSTLLHMLSQL